MTDPERAERLDILTRLVAFDTTSRKSNLALIEWVEAFLHARGVETLRAPNAAGDKTNLIAWIGPRIEGGVVLSGHTDVVPVDGQVWSSDPWALTERAGKLYGRGSADMKSFLALALAAVDAMNAAPLVRPIILAFSYDEEVGCVGVPDLISRLIDSYPRPAAAIIGEPTLMRVVSGHKGISVFHVLVEGREAHSSSRGLGVSAIMEAVPLMQRVADLAREGGAEDAVFNPPGVTATIGRVEGGTAANILAKRCEFLFDLRSPLAEETERLTAAFLETARAADARIKAQALEGGVTVTRRSATPPLLPDPASPAEALARALTGDNGLVGAAYGAEAGLFQRAGIPAVVCGPGSIDQAHQPDEWIALEQLDAGARFLRDLIARLSSSP